MISKRQDKPLPHMKLGPNDISVIESVLMGTINNLRKTAPTTQTTKRIHELENIRQRFLFLGSCEGNGTWLTEDDVRTICEAMKTFVKAVLQRVRPSQEREEALQTIDLLRKSLERHFLV